ncbi:MAG: hypothetical protein WCG10_06120 [Chlamydiota bacterium]
MVNSIPDTCAARSAVEGLYTCPVTSQPSQGTGRNSFTRLKDTPYVFSQFIVNTQVPALKDRSSFPNNGTCDAAPTLASLNRAQERVSYQQDPANLSSYLQPMIDDSDEQYLADFHKKTMKATADWLSDHPGPSVVKDRGITQTDDSYQKVVSNSWNKITSCFESFKTSLFSKAPASLSVFANQGVSLLMQYPLIAGVSLIGLGCFAVKTYSDKVASERQVALVKVKDLKKQNEFYKAVLRLIDPNFSADKTKSSDDLTIDGLKKQNRSLKKQLKKLGISNKDMKQLRVAFLNNTLKTQLLIKKERG